MKGCFLEILDGLTAHLRNPCGRIGPAGPSVLLPGHGLVTLLGGMLGGPALFKPRPSSPRFLGVLPPLRRLTTTGVFPMAPFGWIGWRRGSVYRIPPQAGSEGRTMPTAVPRPQRVGY